jgi:hypothetical protein
VKEILRAAFVIARRDFTAIIYSKAFIFFLLGPFFPILVGVAAGSLGGQIARDTAQPVIGLAMAQADSEKILAARDTLADLHGRPCSLCLLLQYPPSGDLQPLTAASRRHVCLPSTTGFLV